MPFMTPNIWLGFLLGNQPGVRAWNTYLLNHQGTFYSHQCGISLFDLLKRLWIILKTQTNGKYAHLWHWFNSCPLVAL